jgi:hypothetical protein
MNFFLQRLIHSEYKVCSVQKSSNPQTILKSMLDGCKTGSTKNTFCAAEFSTKVYIQKYLKDV